MIDVNKREREYEALYALNNPYGVRQLFENVHRIIENAYGNGDIDALILYLDFAQALKKGHLTQKQKEALRLFYVESMTQQQTAEMLGIAQQKVSDRVDRAIERVAKASGYDKEAQRRDDEHRRMVSSAAGG
ncbi:sigma-70 family RNA polymerase sigma factor [Paenibacillus arenilitoris]|uniref:Sigma-70 family RNA polymerase sigma factor n=1 Tax=Paenibacillus arenilitoris TaxID=2772299 RepID=A0A927CKW2_9BACL|nr:sigma-70 family RNA polymerase sigma factor [Paenibacillus arenilitoris]MBD2867746.1 sigma-70 family RNA polymerase sigma factor [Paenibacillus arenilitoris]